MTLNMSKNKKDKNRWRPDAARRNYTKAFGDKVIRIASNEEEQELLNSDIPFIVVKFVDTETSGLDPEINEILSLSGQSYRLYETGALVYESEIDVYIRNKLPIDPKAAKVNGITEAFLQTQPTREEAFLKIREWFSDMDVFVAYNTPFDMAFIQTLYLRCGKEFPKVKHFDVMAMFIDLYTMYQSQSRKLSDVAKYLELIEGNETFHNSLDDIRMTVKVFAKLSEQYIKLTPTDAEAEKHRPLPALYSNWYWENPQKSTMKRIYFATSHGKLYFELFDRSFGMSDKGQYGFDDINMTGLVKKILLSMGVRSVEELSHLKFPKKSAQ